MSVDCIPCSNCNMDVYDDADNAHIHSDDVRCDEETEELDYITRMVDQAVECEGPEAEDKGMFYAHDVCPRPKLGDQL